MVMTNKAETKFILTCWQISGGPRTYYLVAANEEEMRTWIAAIQNTLAVRVMACDIAYSATEATSVRRRG